MNGLTTVRVALQALAAGAVLGLLVGIGLAWWFYSPRLEAAQLRVATLGVLVEQQNKAVEDLKAAEVKRKADADKAVAEAASRAQAAEAQAQALLAEEKPTGTDECQAARDLIARELAR